MTNSCPCHSSFLEFDPMNSSLPFLPGTVIQNLAHAGQELIYNASHCHPLFSPPSPSRLTVGDFNLLRDGLSQFCAPFSSLLKSPCFGPHARVLRPVAYLTCKAFRNKCLSLRLKHENPQCQAESGYKSSSKILSHKKKERRSLDPHYLLCTT